MWSEINNLRQLEKENGSMSTGWLAGGARVRVCHEQGHVWF